MTNDEYLPFIREEYETYEDAIEALEGFISVSDHYCNLILDDMVTDPANPAFPEWKESLEAWHYKKFVYARELDKLQAELEAIEQAEAEEQAEMEAMAQAVEQPSTKEGGVSLINNNREEPGGSVTKTHTGKISGFFQKLKEAVQI